MVERPGWAPRVLAIMAFTFIISPALRAAERRDVEMLHGPDGKPALMRMAKFLAEAKQFSVSVSSGYDVLQKNGQKIEFLESRDILVSRPDKTRVRFQNPDGDKGMFVYDGKELGMCNETEAAYATAPKNGNLDEVIIYLTRDLGLRMPLSMLLMSNLPEQLEKRVASADIVDTVPLAGKPCSHIAARADNVDVQVWIADGDKPVPLRVVITYKNEAQSPQYWAQLTDWNSAPEMAADAFGFKPPQGAEQIGFFTQRSESTVPAKAKADQK